MEKKISNTKIAIGIAYHKNGIFHNKYPYIPIQVGAKFSDNDLGIQRDDVGDNISHFNPYYSELSATYWLWKNKTDADYIGLFHYRRFLTFESNSFFYRLPTFTLYLASKFAAMFIQDSRCFFPHFSTIKINENEVDKYLDEFKENLQNDINKNDIDCYTLGYMRHSTRTMKTHLNLGIGAKHFEYIDPLIKKMYPDFYKYFQQTLRSNRIIGYNILIAKRELFEEYCSIQFNILTEYCNYFHENLPSGVVNNAILRDFGYAGEILMDAYIRMAIAEKKIKVKKINSVFVDIIPTGLSYSKIPVFKRIFEMIKR